jgi:hypothetical protein
VNDPKRYAKKHLLGRSSTSQAFRGTATLGGNDRQEQRLLRDHVTAVGQRYVKRTLQDTLRSAREHDVAIGRRRDARCDSSDARRRSLSDAPADRKIPPGSGERL